VNVESPIAARHRVQRVARAGVAASLVSLALSSAGVGADPATEEEKLDRHRALWAAAAFDDYEYGYNKYCECHRETPPETLVTIHDGEVVGVRHRPFGSDHEVQAEQRNFEWYWTVEGLFDLVATGLARNAEVRADYDPTLGYPTHVYVDYDANLIGDEVDVRLTRLDRIAR
jgi:hypothetical protein